MRRGTRSLLWFSREYRLWIEKSTTVLPRKILQGNLFAVLIRRTKVRALSLTSMDPLRAVLGYIAPPCSPSFGFSCLPLGAQGTIAQYGRKSSTSKGPRASTDPAFSERESASDPNRNHRGRASFLIALQRFSRSDGRSISASCMKVFAPGYRRVPSPSPSPGRPAMCGIAEGTWLPAGTKAPEKGKSTKPPRSEDKDAPPRLHHGDAKPAEAPPAEKSAPPAPASKPQETVKVMGAPAAR